MRQNTKWRDATLEGSRVNYAMQMPDIATALQITQAQADKVFDILAHQSLNSQDTYATVSADMASAWGEIKKQQDENRRSADADLAQVLGAAKAAEFRQYQSNAPIRSQVYGLQAALAGTPAALRPEQIDQLEGALAADRAAFRAEGTAREFAMPRGGGTTVQVYADEATTYAYTRSTQAHDAAASALSPAQLARFDELQRLSLEQRTAGGVAAEQRWGTLGKSAPTAAVPVEAPTPPKNIPSACARPQQPVPSAIPDTRKLLADPSYRAVQLKANRATIAIGMVDQAKVLHLSPGETDQLMDMLAEQRIRQEEAMPPPGANSAERQRVFADLRRTFDSEREKLLGSEKFEEFKKYRDSRRARTEVYLLRSQLAASAQPLRDDQVEPLVDAIGEELKRLDEESTPSDSAATPFSSVAAPDALEADRELDRFKTAIERMHDSVSLLLMPEQLARWDRMMQLELAQERARDKVERAESDFMKQAAATKL